MSWADISCGSTLQVVFAVCRVGYVGVTALTITAAVAINIVKPIHQKYIYLYIVSKKCFARQ